MRFHFLNSVQRGEEADNPDLSTASYDNVSFGVGAQASLPVALAFSSDGTKMYIVDNTSAAVYQYTLSTAWDLGSASYDSVLLDVGGQEGSPGGLAFSSDGTKMYVAGDATDAVYQYTLSTAWDLGSASFASKSFGVGAQDGVPAGVIFSLDGTKMYVTGFDTSTVYQYTLSTAWDISTASFNTVSFGVGAEDGAPQGVAFSSDGTKMYMTGETTDTVYQYTLSTAWDLGTSSFDNVSFGVGSQDSAPREGVFSPNDISKMYVVGSTNDSVYQYSV